MAIRSTLIPLFALALAATSSSAADQKSIQGTFLGEDGKPIAGAEVRARRLDAKAKVAVAKTDAGGRYVFQALPAGSYELTAYVHGSAKSRVNVRAQAKGWVKADFDLRLNDADNSDVDRMQRDLHTNTGPLPGP